MESPCEVKMPEHPLRRGKRISFPPIFGLGFFFSIGLSSRSMRQDLDIPRRNIEQLSPISDGVTAAVFQDRGIKCWGCEKGGSGKDVEEENKGEERDKTRRVPSREASSRRAEKTSMLHLCGEYSRVTLHLWASRERERERGLTGGGRAPSRDGDTVYRGNGRWEREGCDTPAACWQLYRVTLRRLSIRQPFESLATIFPRLFRSSIPFSLSLPFVLRYVLYRGNDNVLGIHRQQPLMSRCSYIVSDDTNARFRSCWK